jgi:hypothetical protein
VNKSKRSETIRPGEPAPPRRRGRPPLPASQAKLHPLTVRTTKPLRDALEQASKASGRSLTQEIEFHLERSLGLDRDKGPEDLRIERLWGIFKEAVLGLLPAATAGTVNTGRSLIFDRQVLGDYGLIVETKADPAAAPTPKRKPKPKSRRAMYMEPGEAGEAARLLPVELDVTRGDDGNLVVVSRHSGRVIREYPIDTATARQLAEQLLMAATSMGSTRQQKSRRR